MLRLGSEDMRYRVVLMNLSLLLSNGFDVPDLTQVKTVSECNILNELCVATYVHLHQHGRDR